MTTNDAIKAARRVYASVGTSSGRHFMLAVTKKSARQSGLLMAPAESTDEGDEIVGYDTDNGCVLWTFHKEQKALVIGC